MRTSIISGRRVDLAERMRINHILCSTGIKIFPRIKEPFDEAKAMHILRSASDSDINILRSNIKKAGAMMIRFLTNIARRYPWNRY